jgi:hypothetical protein
MTIVRSNVSPTPAIRSLRTRSGSSTAGYVDDRGINESENGSVGGDCEHRALRNQTLDPHDVVRTGQYPCNVQDQSPSGTFRGTAR